MSVTWYKAGREAGWVGRVEVIENHTRIWHKDWPKLSDEDIAPTSTHYINHCLANRWWERIDTDLEVDEGL